MWWKNEKIICFDLGGTHLRKAVIDFFWEKPKFLDFEKEINEPKNKLKNKVLKYAQKAKEKYKTNKIAIASAGIVNNLNKKIFQAKQVYGEEIFDWKFLEKENFSVFLENDGRSFVWGNYVFGLKKEYFSVLGLVFGTGIGGGFIIGDKNYQGANFASLEVSHLFFKQVNNLVDWENLSAGKGIEKQYFLLTKKAESAEKIFDLADKGEKEALMVLKEAGEYFSLGLANLINLFDPEVFVLGGKMVEKRKNFFQKAVKNSQNQIFNQKNKIKIFYSHLKEKANLLGVGDLMRRK